ncbi:MAG: methyltransferase [Planctomycetota bacterium]
MNKKEVLQYFRNREKALKTMELMGPEGQMDQRGAKKLEEIAGSSEIILRYVQKFLPDDDLVIFEGACGKSYLGFALALMIPDVDGRKVKLWGVDANPDLIARCRELSDKLELDDAQFTAARMAECECDMDVNLSVSLHACNTATDEVIAKGIELDSRLIISVPCCQSQIRGQLKEGHPLSPMTEYGPARYRLANLLTDTLRAQFLNAAGYHVQLDEIGSPRLTPKNLCICARKVKRPSKKPRYKGYVQLRDMFDVQPEIESLCPDVVGSKNAI